MSIDVKEKMLARNLIKIKKKLVVSFKTKRNTILIAPKSLLNDQLVERSTNFLGLITDMHLNWDNHITNLLQKVSSGIYALSSLTLLCYILQNLENDIFFKHPLSYCNTW